jgi:hypothetical protein
MGYSVDQQLPCSSAAGAFAFFLAQRAGAVRVREQDYAVHYKKGVAEQYARDDPCFSDTQKARASRGASVGWLSSTT